MANPNVKPNSRETLKQWCLRRLGKPVIEINVDDDQLEDRLDESLQMYSEYHFDAVEKVYEAHELTAQDITNEFINVPSPGWSNTADPDTSDSYIGITRIFEGQGTETGMFDIKYQLRLNDAVTFGPGSGGSELLTYEMRQRNIALAEELLRGKVPIRFQRHQNRLYIDWQWSSDATVGEFVVIEATKIINPETFTDVYNDIWLKEYTVALFKEQWGQNLSKFTGVTLPGGVGLDGARILTEAREEITTLKQEMSSKYELPVDFYMS